VKILALEKNVPGTTDDQFNPHLKAEAARAWELYQSGIIRELYFRADREEAVLLLECSNVDEAKSVVNSLPLVRAGLIAFDIIPLKAYPGFARLFASQTLANNPSDTIHPNLPFSQETNT
jgi:muconolactone delta-isomerase